MATPTSTLAGKLLLSVEETAILLGQTRSTLYRAIHAETLPLPVHLVGRRMKIPRAAVDRLLAGLGPAAPAPEAIGAQASAAPEGPGRLGRCPLCGRSTSPPPATSRPTCSAARRSSSATTSV